MQGFDSFYYVFPYWSCWHAISSIQNKNLFHEMTLAYQQGRMAKDPVEFWYKGELGFFDNYSKFEFGYDSCKIR